jgi:hypothetical protein
MAIIDYHSIRSGKFASLSLTAKALIPVLSCICARDGSIQKGKKALAELAGISVRSVYNALRELKAAGIVSFVSTQGKAASIQYRPQIEIIGKSRKSSRTSAGDAQAMGRSSRTSAGDAEDIGRRCRAETSDLDDVNTHHDRAKAVWHKPCVLNTLKREKKNERTQYSPPDLAKSMQLLGIQQEFWKGMPSDSDKKSLQDKESVSGHGI